jgi:Tat protein secretion system quality control protein TatD with DNase activity
VGVPGEGWVSVVGIHPTLVSSTGLEDIRGIVESCFKNGWAIGEVGLDYFKGQR